MPAQIGAMKPSQVGEEETSITEKSIFTDHSQNKVPYVLMYSYEYGKTIDDIKVAIKLDDAINKALNGGLEIKAR